MTILGTTTISSGETALRTLLAEITTRSLDWNEAETRFQILDRIILECLGWDRAVMRLEQPHGRTYSDYELGRPRVSIWEAKRENRTFELPANPTGKLLQD